MKWIEQLRVRSSAQELDRALPALTKIIDAINASKDAAEAFVMQHAVYDGDLTVVVVWRKNVPSMKTREGSIIAEYLKDYGPVDHAAWIPTNCDPENAIL